MNRRTFVLGLSCLLSFLASSARLQAAPKLGKAWPFSLDLLRQRARELASKPYQPSKVQLPEPLIELTYDQYRDIRFLANESLWLEKNLPFTAQFFHPGFYYKTPARVFEVVEERAKEIRYSPTLFDFGRNKPDRSLLKGLGFAGFRVHYPLNAADRRDELIAFQGGTYFRAVGHGMRYGVSARGLAIATASEEGEEFPSFTEFYLERPVTDNSLVIHALLNSVSTTGVYTFTVRPGEITVTDVSLMLYPRKRLGRVGLAPLTSMYFFGANDRIGVDDFRPEVHDSDGLMISNGRGEWLWRPLDNPVRLRISSFLDHNPQGFGLMQRNRDFASYQDLESRYEMRPCLWVEPVGSWGEGVVKLVEIPTANEINDNIVVFWEPKDPPNAGSEWPLTYRLHWCRQTPVNFNTALVVATRVGHGESERARKFVIDFAGEKLPKVADAPLTAEVWASRGTVKNIVSQFNEVTGNWRAFFELIPEGRDPIELRCFLQLGEAALSETWTYQWSE